MSAAAVAFTIVGVTTVCSQIFRVIDAIEKPRRSRR